jgi:hypothetical protein
MREGCIETKGVIEERLVRATAVLDDPRVMRFVNWFFRVTNFWTTQTM